MCFFPNSSPKAVETRTSASNLSRISLISKNLEARKVVRSAQRQSVESSRVAATAQLDLARRQWSEVTPAREIAHLVKNRGGRGNSNHLSNLSNLSNLESLARDVSRFRKEETKRKRLSQLLGEARTARARTSRTPSRSRTRRVYALRLSRNTLALPREAFFPTKGRPHSSRLCGVSFDERERERDGSVWCRSKISVSLLQSDLCGIFALWAFL